MVKLLGTGLLAAFFFSSTFILNRAMSLEGGHWVWTASLRYLWMTLFLVIGPILIGRGRLLFDALRLLYRYWRFWVVAGTVGFGVFYAGIAFAASYAPGWVVATTWQITVLASPLVLLLYGRRVPLRGVVFTVLIFVGVLLVNLGEMNAAGWREVVLGGLPVLIAAFAYPLGLQLVWEARSGGHTRIPHIVDPVLGDSFARVLLLTLGSLPFWLMVILVTQPPPPSAGQWMNTALVALLSGVVATSLFVYARHQARNAYELAAVDATQAAEVLFALAGEMLLLGTAFPSIAGVLGAGMTVLGLILYLLAQGKR
ncbi:MAG: multidrug resistance efflux transporter family protein [Caldilinea sp.]|nr:multidrug resistance efflux transporter family protein [Caldilinea sp.]MDW8439359.1 multidrug resistance efflux transporter family protein [Caldilineaceae bacterium]